MKLIRLIYIIIICVCLNGCAIWLADDNVQREVYYTTHYRAYHPAPYRPASKPTYHTHPDGHQTHRPSGKPGKPGKPNQKPTVKPKPNQKPNNGNNPRPNGSVSSSPNRPRPKK